MSGADWEDFVHLHVQTPYSFYEGVGQIDEMAGTAARLGQRAISFTDRNRVSGLVRGYKAANDYGLQPVLGLLLDDPASIRRSMLLWAKNLDGYGELCRLAAERQLNSGFSLEEAIPTLNTNVIAASSDSKLMGLLREHGTPGQVYGLLQAFECDRERTEARKTYDRARELGLPLTVSGNVSCVTPKQVPLGQLLRAIGEKRVLLQQAKGVLDRQIRPFDDGGKLLKQFGGVRDALLNTRLISEQCKVDLKLGTLKFPSPVLPSDRKPFTELRDRAEAGSRKRYGPSPPVAVRERLAYELGVIDHLGFTGYMLVVHDIAQRAWNKGVRTIGRGSAANSMVCYCLELTDICPLKYDLYFERFLNPERTSPPDIDLDFSWRDRDEILHGVYDMYGHDRVAMISTTVTFGARAALHEAALAQGMPEEEITRITKRVPHFSHPESLEKLKEESPECADLPLDRDPWKSIARSANALLGLPRHLSIHAGGIVITEREITRWTGLERASKGFVITQYDMYGIEDLGLVKIDLLSQRALGVLKDTMRLVVENGGDEPPVDDVERVFADPPTRELLRTGNSMGVFYVESPGMLTLNQKLDCDNFELLVAASSVIRPGVSESGMMQQFIERVRNPSKAVYLHPEMRKLLHETHGVMIYQEDVIKVAHHIAGLPLGRADLLRRAMSGKSRSHDEMKKLVNQFLDGCRARGIEERVAKEIWRQIESFAGYSFCKAHSASFAVLSMQIAYLKTHHPAEFFASVLANGGGYYSQAAYVEEAKRYGLDVRLPDVNRSDREHSGGSGVIQLGLRGIGALRDATISRVVDNRQQEGEYSGLGDLIRRVHPARDEAEALVMCGACDGFGLNRPTLLRNLRVGYDAYLEGPGLLALDADDPFADLPESQDWTAEERYRNERKILGFSPGPHPLALLRLPIQGSIPAREMRKYEGKRISMVGWAYSYKRITTRKKRETMEFMSMEDLTGTFEVTLFPGVYRRYATMLRGNGPFKVWGVVESDHGVVTLTAQKVEQLASLDRKSA
ncbi:DNA polymerase III subunit alpha [bacterium]|nr:DNA polymerase III subunit alpha [bacterium]